MRLRRIAILVATLSVAASSSSPSFAQPAPETTREARERFDRGLKLFEEGDNAGALAEFKRAYELIPNPIVLYNVGLSYAAMNRAVEAVEALDKVLASPGKLSAERLARAKSTRDEQERRIAELDVKISVPGAVVELDGVEVGKSPLAGPLKVSGGTHIVGAVAAGFTPARKEVTVAGKAHADVTLELVTMPGRLAHLTVKTHLPGADLVVDDQAIAKTPLPASLTMAPGPHKIELRRPGYVSARQDITLGDGATGEVTLEPEEETGTSEKGSLRLELAETQCVVAIDGKQRGVYAGPLELPRGPHRLRVERGGFFAFERDVTVEAGRDTLVRVDLDPKPETRAAYESSARFHTTWGWIGVASGAAIAGAGGVFLALNGKKKSDAQSQLDAVVASGAKGSGGACDTAAGANPDVCRGLLDDADAKLSAAKSRDVYGYVGLGVGGAALITGVVLLATRDSGRYDRKSSGETLAKGITPLVSWAPGGGSLGLGGSF